MQVVSEAALAPAQCSIIPSGHGPFIDTHRVDAVGHRIYVSLEAYNELERLYREAGVATVAARAIAELGLRLQQQESELAGLREAADELAKLRAAVGFTLEAGRGAVQKKDGSNQLRSQPGQKTVRV
jgi:hypothetical protein